MDGGDDDDDDEGWWWYTSIYQRERCVDMIHKLIVMIQSMANEIHNIRTSPI